MQALTVMVRDVKQHSIDEEQLKVLLTYAEEDIHDSNRQATAFSLLKVSWDQPSFVDLETTCQVKEGLFF